jgi:ABC-type xylose transport system permease subunit
MGNASSRSPDRTGKIPPALQAPGWSLVAGIAAVPAAIYFLDSSRAVFSEDSRQTPPHQVALFGALSIGAVAVVASLMFGATVLGRHFFALGGNEAATRLSRPPTRRLKAFAYGHSGMLAAPGGILLTGRSGQADRQLGATYELHAITAAAGGGCSLSGGIGSIRGPCSASP